MRRNPARAGPILRCPARTINGPMVLPRSRDECPKSTFCNLEGQNLRPSGPFPYHRSWFGCFAKEPRRLCTPCPQRRRKRVWTVTGPLHELEQWFGSTEPDTTPARRLRPRWDRQAGRDRGGHGLGQVGSKRFVADCVPAGAQTERANVRLVRVACQQVHETGADERGRRCLRLAPEPSLERGRRHLDKDASI